MMTYDQMVEALPHYINGTLDSEVAELIQRALTQNTDLQHELEFLQQIKSSVQTQVMPSPSEWGFARLKKSIEEQASKESNENDERKDSSPKTEVNKKWKMFALAASFMVAIQSVYFIGSINSVDESYRTLSTSNIGDTIKVQFTEEVTAREVRLLLNRLQGSIVQGPTALGFYDVVFANKEEALAVLKASNIIEYAEQNSE